jgi:hypothetical protein
MQIFVSKINYDSIFAIQNHQKFGFYYSKIYQKLKFSIQNLPKTQIFHSKSTKAQLLSPKTQSFSILDPLPLPRLSPPNYKMDSESNFLISDSDNRLRVIVFSHFMSNSSIFNHFHLFSAKSQRKTAKRAVEIRGNQSAGVRNLQRATDRQKTEQTNGRR